MGTQKLSANFSFEKLKTQTRVSSILYSVFIYPVLREEKEKWTVLKKVMAEASKVSLIGFHEYFKNLMKSEFDLEDKLRSCRS